MAIIRVTSIADSGKGTFREAILNANSRDTIRFDSALANKTIRLKEQLVIDKTLTIDGADASNLTISGENKTRILKVSYNYSDVVLRNLTFANGRAVDSDPNKTLRGGAIELADSNTLVVENSRFIKNVGERSGAIFVGYGASATIKDSVFDGNDGSVAKDGFSAGAISTYGGGQGATVVNSNGERNVGGNAFLNISNSTFTNNKGTYGAVYTLLTGLKVEDSVFRKNQGVGGSGAIFTDGANGTEKPDNLGGTTLIRNVIAEDNVGGGDYGGAFFLSGYSKDKIVIENSKIANNKANKGGGLAVQSYRDEANPASLIIRNSTIANNTSPSQGGGLWTDVKGGVTIEDSTFSGNRVTNSNKNGQIGGAIALNYKTQAKSTITNSTFVNNYADRQAGNIWIAGETQGKNLTISKSKFAGNRSPQFNGESERTVNFKVTDGGGNVVQNIKGADTSIAGAKLVTNLQLAPVPQNAGDFGSNPGELPVDTGLESEPIPTLKNDPLRYEAEELTLNGYQVETVKDSGASGGKHISLKGAGQNQGSATGQFEGETGTYQVKVGYYDENDGQSKATVTVGEKTASFVFDQDLPDSWAKPAAKTSRIAVESVQLKSGDTFKIEATSNQGEFARFDYIEFSPINVEASSVNNPTPQSTPIPIENNLASEPSEPTINGIVNLRNVDFDGDGKTDEKVLLTLEDINSTASYNNSGGFYQVLDLDGTVVDTVTNQPIRPGEKGYETAALNQRMTQLEFGKDDGSLSVEVDGGIFLAAYAIANGTAEEFLDQNPTNNQNPNGLNAYFVFGNANPDGQQHLKSSGNSLGLEYLYDGGDQSFDDLTFNVNVKSA
ncbi:DUF4114 domain-containing protein [Rivularia sp. UHCC 0363]|uniref:DUF4114 domain-containing protein n=1 Tax=Rivularia sp. UHCC 0363 TaxID=3110244 RepID=UPI002B202A2B|nr:DUF4114 domain-containing protein [Rivularia sp. UHCC 0363]MEA5595411.1 DUF4114 domain-containing protein [Rivularia sp. UHCC 0363]